MTPENPADEAAPVASVRVARAPRPGEAGPLDPPVASGPAGQSSSLLLPQTPIEAATGRPDPVTRAGISGHATPARARGRTQTPGEGMGASPAPSPGLQGAEWRAAVKAAQAGNRHRKPTRARQPAPALSLPPMPPGTGAGLTATAHCISPCEWTAGPGPAGDVDRAAEKHVRTGHPTATVAGLGGAA